MKVLAGDWKEGINVLVGPNGVVFQKGVFRNERVPLSEIANFDMVTEENKASILGKVGWGAAGAIVLGPLGLLAGVLGGGNKKDRVMAVRFKDGRKALIKGGPKDVEAFNKYTFSLS
ncbi:hypothetical protein [Brucella sp.]|uniref:hypothetical protein n=1 Tax=Brucella sp. TaxID=52132 RepID=UPI0028B1546F|nr:hypothetical protein [Brucella sp.]